MHQCSKDWELLRQYVEKGNEGAFAQIVNAYVDLVYAASLRRVGSAELAEEVTQMVFVILSRKAVRLDEHVILSSWLHTAAVFTSRNALRARARRHRHEREAALMMQDLRMVNLSWHRLSPLLDEGIQSLRQRDRQAIILRFFQRLSLRDVGLAMEVSEEAAQMRVTRALGKLRVYFKRRGVDLEAEALGGIICVNAMQVVAAKTAGSLAASVLQAVRAAPFQTPPLARASIRAMAQDRLRAAATWVLGTLLATTLCIILLRQAILHMPGAWSWLRSPSPTLEHRTR